MGKISAKAKTDITPSEWEDIEQRYVNNDHESAVQIAAEYGITEAAIRRRFGARKKKIKEIANQLVAIDEQMKDLPPHSRKLVNQLAEKLKVISEDIASGAVAGAAIYKKLMETGQAHARKVDGQNDLAADVIHLKAVAMFTQTANEAVKTPLALITSGKAIQAEPPKDPEDEDFKTVTTVEAANAYRRMLG